jgi:hypothetical protein
MIAPAPNVTRLFTRVKLMVMTTHSERPKLHFGKAMSGAACPSAPTASTVTALRKTEASPARRPSRITVTKEKPKR